MLWRAGYRVSERSGLRARRGHVPSGRAGDFRHGSGISTARSRSANRLAHFCHGVAGLLAITLRFAADTGLQIFVEQADRLTHQMLDRFQPESLLGFRNIEYDNNETDQPGLLDGAAGVAIVLLSASTGIEPVWDRAFLLS